MKKITLSVILLPLLLMAAAPTVTFDKTSVTTTTGTIEMSGSGSIADLGNDSTITLSAAAGDNYTGTLASQTIIYTPNTNTRNTIYGGDGDDLIIPIDSELEDYYGQYYGEGGNDFIELTWGLWSEAYGGDGDDTIVAYRGNHGTTYQYFYGNAGNDKIYLPERFDDNSARVFGGTDFDTIIVYGTFADYQVEKNSGRYYLKQLSSGNRIQFLDVEKFIFSVDPTPNIVGSDEGEIYYFDNSIVLSPNPTNTSNAELQTITLYEHHFSLDTTNAAGYNLYINNISDKIYSIKDVVANTETTLLGRNTTDNAENVTGQVSYFKMLNAPGDVRDMILLGNEEILNIEASNIRTTIFF